MAILSAVDCGTLHMINPEDRLADYLVTDSSIGTSFNSSDVCDVSGDVPNGTKAILVFYIAWSTDTNDLAILYTRRDGETVSDDQKTYTVYFGAQIGAMGYYCQSGHLIIPVSTDRKFAYRTNSTYTITDIRMMLWGYYL